MLEPTAFMEQYGDGFYIPGTDNRLYESDEYLVKTGSLDVMLIELACYSTYKHSGIVELYGWTFDDLGVLRLALQHGTALDRTSRLDTANLCILISDLVSVCSFLHTASRPIVHGDIKPENIVKVNGHYKLIDFGNALIGYKECGETRYYGSAYTEDYRANEYDPDIPHTTAAETFSVGKTVESLVLKNNKNTMIASFIAQTTEAVVKDRILVESMRTKEMPGGLVLPGRSSWNPNIDSTIRDQEQELWYKCVSNILQLCIDVGTTLRTLFLCLANSRRCFGILCQLKTVSELGLYVNAQVAMALAVIESRKIPDGSYPKKMYYSMLRTLLGHLQGQTLTFTYWELVDNATVFIGLIQEMAFIRQPWSPTCSKEARIYKSAEWYLRVFYRAYHVDVRDIESIERVCTAPLVQPESIYSDIKDT
jgi:serine/threonine protein kinase